MSNPPIGLPKLNLTWASYKHVQTRGEPIIKRRSTAERNTLQELNLTWISIKYVQTSGEPIIECRSTAENSTRTRELWAQSRIIDMDIAVHCANEWDFDWRMFVYCVKQQEAAKAKL